MRHAAVIGRKQSTRATRIPEVHEPFQEQSWTLVVGPHGGLLALAASVERGQKLRLGRPEAQFQSAI